MKYFLFSCMNTLGIIMLRLYVSQMTTNFCILHLYVFNFSTMMHFTNNLLINFTHQQIQISPFHDNKPKNSLLFDIIINV